MRKSIWCQIIVLGFAVGLLSCDEDDEKSSDNKDSLWNFSDYVSKTDGRTDYSDWVFYGKGVANEYLFKHSKGTGEKCDPETYKTSCEDPHVGIMSDGIYDTFVYCHPETKEVTKANCLEILGMSAGMGCIEASPGCSMFCGKTNEGLMISGCVEVGGKEYFELQRCNVYGDIGVYEFSVKKCKDMVVNICCNTEVGDSCDPETYINECEDARTPEEMKLITCDPVSKKIIRKSCAEEDKICQNHNGVVQCFEK